MKQKSVIQIKALLLVLIYLIGSLPTSLFHHHKLEDLSKKHDSLFSKTVHHQHIGIFCSHEAQIDTIEEHCAFCDNHVNAPHLNLSESTLPISAIHFVLRQEIRQNVATLNYNSLDNRGPPSMV